MDKTVFSFLPKSSYPFLLGAAQQLTLESRAAVQKCSCIPSLFIFYVETGLAKLPRLALNLEPSCLSFSSC